MSFQELLIMSVRARSWGCLYFSNEGQVKYIEQVLSRSCNGAETADNYFTQKVKIVTHIIGLGLNNSETGAKYSTQT